MTIEQGLENGEWRFNIYRKLVGIYAKGISSSNLIARFVTVRQQYGFLPDSEILLSNIDWRYEMEEVLPNFLNFKPVGRQVGFKLWT